MELLVVTQSNGKREILDAVHTDDFNNDQDAWEQAKKLQNEYIKEFENKQKVYIIAA